MQYDRKADGHLEPLPHKVIDTGMGFERLCMAMQGKKSNYDTDLFTPLIRAIETLSGEQYGQNEQVDIAMRVVADHIRTIAFAIADGQLPSNAKAGYVIRRILRRAVRYAYTFLHADEPMLYTLLPTLNEVMGEAYPEIVAQRELIASVIKEEEELPPYPRSGTQASRKQNPRATRWRESAVGCRCFRPVRHLRLPTRPHGVDSLGAWHDA